MRAKIALASALGIIAFSFLYAEFLHFYVVIWSCSWPPLVDNGLSTLLLADPHLLGWSRGHWLDKLRREWEIERVFQTTLTLLSPEAVFLLGDVTDEGKWASDLEMQDHQRRFNKIFRHDRSIEFFTVAGNHDVGFHEMMSARKVNRFSAMFGSRDPVDHIKLRGVNFVLLNSMAFEGDGCNICVNATKQIRALAKKLDGKSAPILMQHFPLYRSSDAHCEKTFDSMPEEDRYTKMKERYDCLSQEATSLLLNKLNPRLVFGGHTHFSCYRKHSSGAEEWSIPSISWRNIKTPSFMLVSVNATNHSVSKCATPDERTADFVHFVSAVFLVILFFAYMYRCVFPCKVLNTQSNTKYE